VLVDKGANVNAPGKDGDIPLQAASLNGHLNIVQVLIEKGADVNAQVRGSGKVLQAALQRGWSANVQLFKNQGQSDCIVEERE
ncbi:hypothetical protein B0H14DRAFT_2386490, partial [Mycena olivaceomarginata]